MKASYPTYDNLNEGGYLIVDDVLDEETREMVREAIVSDAINLIFRKQGFEVDAADPESTLLLVDQTLREEKLGTRGKRCVWRGGNTLYPLINKTTGMVHIHFNSVVMEQVTFNEELYQLSARINGTPHLAFTSGPERVSIKAKGATSMDKHIDANPFDSGVNYPFRIQSLLVLDIDTVSAPKDSGTLCILPYFHHYWDFAGKLFHPKTGFFDCKFPEDKSTHSRFFRLPKGRKSFDKVYLPQLKRYAAAYADFLEGTLDWKQAFGIGTGAHRKFFEVCKKAGVVVPSNSRGYIEKMVWTPLPLKPGSIVFWHQHLPHFSLRNNSDTARVVAYYNLFPVDEDWWGTEEQLWVQRQFQRGEFYYGTDWGKYPTHIINKEEHEHLKLLGKIDDIAALSTTTAFRRKLSGQEDHFD